MFNSLYYDKQQSIPLVEWLTVIQSEYLGKFIKKGGAAVKFTIPSENKLNVELSSGLEKVAMEENYCSISLKADTVKIHMIDKLFFAIAKQIDWDVLTSSFLRQLLATTYIVPQDETNFNIETLAQLNGLPVSEMGREMNIRLTNSLLRDYYMTQEFRIAMFRFCRSQIDPEVTSPEEVESIRLWLHGELSRISELKKALIFQKIGRHNARDMIASLAHWLRLAGMAGLLLILDISRYLVSPRPRDPDGTRYYRLPAVLDVYDVLRQFIDDTDELENCLLVVIAPPDFITNEIRGVLKYDALQLRILDEVYDRKKANPLSSLIRLSGSPQQGSEEYSTNLSQE